MDSSLQNIGDIAMTQSSASKLSALSGAKGNIDKTSQDFEGMFMTQMLQPMFEGLKPDELFGGGHGEEVMRGFLLQEYGKMVAKTGHIGIASAVKSEMIRAQQIAAQGHTGSNGVENVPVQ